MNIFSTEQFEQQYTYTGNDLGATYEKEKTFFRVWAPTADKVILRLYQTGTPEVNDLMEEIAMKQDVFGTWVVTKMGDLQGVYYTYFVVVDGKENEACDPYARTTGINGKRAMVIDLEATNPKGWELDVDPNAGKALNDAIIYELHLRDLSIDNSSGIVNKGKYLGLTEMGTKNPAGYSTGLDYIKELGITHLHLLPIYDYGVIDEGNLETPQFNWGYDPINYNVPEGSYATDPYHGEVRVKELKKMVQALHKNGISVVMDVVYNHVYNAVEFCFNQIVPMYFTRIDSNGFFSVGSGCGNDTATERSMVRKYIVDSVTYWVKEYHIDGFRFDLAGLIDTQTLNEVIESVHEIRPSVVFYGEGWILSTHITKGGYRLANQENAMYTPKMAYFSDTMRDLLKGNVFNPTEKGYVSGALGKEKILENCFFGIGSKWCDLPIQTVNYASCHDNMTLFDRIVSSAKDATREEQIRMNNLAVAIYMTSQGIPFIHAGEELLRTKVREDGSFDENSYISSDKVNSLKWDTLNQKEYQQVLDYYKGLIAFRKAHMALHLKTGDEVKQAITVVKGLEPNVVAFQIKGGINGEIAKQLFVIFNANRTETKVTLPKGNWKVYINGEKAGTTVIEIVKDNVVTVAPISALVLCEQEDMEEEVKQERLESLVDIKKEKEKNTSFFSVALGAGVAIAVLTAIYHKKK